jgi:hypothetical protein
MIYSVSSSAAALQLAEHMRASGTCNWFRGQTRNWPLQSSLSRRDEVGRNQARERLARFSDWISDVPELHGSVQTVDEIFGVAQHYGIPTNYVDFTTEPSVAGFFASHEPPPTKTDGDVSCITCVNTEELARVWEAVRQVRTEWPPFAEVHVNVPELWRIQAQRGVFLFYPFDEGFEASIFNFDRICFPPAESAGEISALIAEEDIYPTQQSDLEILLDQYFMLERMARGNEALRAAAFTITFPSLPDGIDAECFGPVGLPEHDSWRPDRLAGWSLPAPEHWTAISKAPELEVKWPPGAGTSESREKLADHLAHQIGRVPECRKGPVRWKHLRESGEDFNFISTSMSFFWDGVRRWPFSNDDVSHGLATAAVFAEMIAAEPRAQADPDLAGSLAARCLGSDDTIEVEVGMADGSYTRGWAVPEDLDAAIRDDFASYLNDTWRPRINSIRSKLQISNVPQRTFVFERLATVFARQIVPTQVVHRASTTGQARLYNPARAISFGLP